MANGHISIVQSLLALRRKKLNVNAENATGETAISIAAKVNHLAMVRCLFKAKGFKLGKKQVENILPHIVERGGFEMAKLILAEYEKREETAFVPYYVASWISRCAVLSTQLDRPQSRDNDPKEHWNSSLSRLIYPLLPFSPILIRYLSQTASSDVTTRNMTHVGHHVGIENGHSAWQVKCFGVVGMRAKCFGVAGRVWLA